MLLALWASFALAQRLRSPGILLCTILPGYMALASLLRPPSKHFTHHGLRVNEAAPLAPFEGWSCLMSQPATAAESSYSQSLISWFYVWFVEIPAVGVLPSSHQTFFDFCTIREILSCFNTMSALNVLCGKFSLNISNSSLSRSIYR